MCLPSSSRKVFAKILQKDCSLPSKNWNFEVKLKIDSHLIMDRVGACRAGLHLSSTFLEILASCWFFWTNFLAQLIKLTAGKTWLFFYMFLEHYRIPLEHVSTHFKPWRALSIEIKEEHLLYLFVAKTTPFRKVIRQCLKSFKSWVPFCLSIFYFPPNKFAGQYLRNKWGNFEWDHSDNDSFH